MRKALRFSMLALLPASCLLADFSYEQTSKVTGGAMATMMKVMGAFSKKMREPVRSTVAVKGDRMVDLTADSANIIDISKETITNVDFKKKTYSVMTFAEMKQVMEKLADSMKSKKERDQPEMQFKVSANSTGQTKQIAGFDTKQMILKMQMEAADQKSGQKGAMVITTDMWIAPAIAGYQEVTDFYKRMAEKLAWTPGGNMFMQNPEVAKGMAEVSKEVAKVNGMPVLQIVVMGADGAQGQQGADAPPQQQEKQAEAPSGGLLGGALGGKLGGFGGFGRKKKEPKPEDAPASQPAGSSASGSLIEMTTELSGFSSAAVDASKFEVPAGFKQVESELKKHAK